MSKNIQRDKKSVIIVDFFTNKKYKNKTYKVTFLSKNQCFSPLTIKWRKPPVASYSGSLIDEIEKFPICDFDNIEKRLKYWLDLAEYAYEYIDVKTMIEALSRAENWKRIGKVYMETHKGR